MIRKIRLEGEREGEERGEVGRLVKIRLWPFLPGPGSRDVRFHGLLFFKQKLHPKNRHYPEKRRNAKHGLFFFKATTSVASGK